MKKFSMLLMGILTLSMVQGAFASSLNLDSRSRQIEISVVDAFYTTLDGDGLYDDVRVILRLVHEGRTGLVKMETGLVLPSGYTTSYSYRTVVDDGRYIMILDFHNEATESGWYKFFLKLYFQGGSIVGNLVHDFDPPEEKQGGDPHLTVTLSDA